MNLIEQLGGYDRAKKLVDDCKRYGRSDVKVPVNGGFIHIVADFLELDLLDYRRQHNIYEIDDYVVYQGDAGLSGLFRIEKLTKTGKPKSVKSNSLGGFPCRYCEVRHATDAEIAAGRRL